MTTYSSFNRPLQYRIAVFNVQVIVLT